MVWSCAVCTFDNRKDDAVKCEICETRREGVEGFVLASHDEDKRALAAGGHQSPTKLLGAKRKMAQRDLHGNVIVIDETKKPKKKEKAFPKEAVKMIVATAVTAVVGPPSNQNIPIRQITTSATVSNSSFEDLVKRTKRIMKEVFGIHKLRKLQPLAVECALRRQSQIIVMATGGGKSLCYQLPATVLGGLTLVISPLIALMIDQVKALNSKGVAAALLCSANTERENSAVMERLLGRSPNQNNRAKDDNNQTSKQAPPTVFEPITLLYCTPELIKTDRFRHVLMEIYRQNRLAMVAVDEAHLVSTWGHDFRPSYRDLSWLRTSFPNVPCMACTATATANVIKDMRQILLLKEDEAPCHVGSFDRPNIFYKVAFKDTLDATTPRGAIGDMIDFIKKQHARGAKDSVPCSGIVYCHTRSDTSALASQITSMAGVRAAPYHAGLKDAERSQVQQRWMSGEVQVAVATVALGMGIDLPHIRYVIHWTLSKSLEGFYQESGRAGRDQLASHSILYYSQSDASLFSFLAQKQRNPSRALDALQQMVNYCITDCCRRQYILRHFGEEIDPAQCKQTCDYCRDPQKVKRAISTAQVVKDVTATRNGFNRKQKADDDGQWDRPHEEEEEDRHLDDDWDVGDLAVTSSRAAVLDSMNDKPAPRLPPVQGFVKASSILSRYEVRMIRKYFLDFSMVY